MRILILSEFIFNAQALSSYLAGLAPENRLLEASGIDEFAARYPGILPDVILVVIRWEPGGEHRIFRNLAHIRNLYPQSQNIVYTDAPLHLAKKMLRKSVLGYLTHKATSDDLRTCIAEVANGKKFMETEILTAMLGSIKSEYLQGARAKFTTLSPREHMVAKMLISQEAVKDIAGKLQINRNSVLGIKKRIFNKLNIANLPMLAQVMRLSEKGENPAGRSSEAV